MAPSSISPFGVLLAKIREEQHRPGRARIAGRAASSPAVQSGPEPDLVIETGVVSGPRWSTQGMARARWPVSLLLHAGLVITLVVVPLLRSESLPTPARETRAFFVVPASPAVPLPPPAAPAAGVPRSASRPPVPPTPPAAASFTAPVDVPETVVAPAADGGPVTLDHDAPGGEAGGAPGGVSGGVPGGIVGGVVGGVAEPPAPVAPVRVGGEIREPRKIRHVTPVYPDLAMAAHVHGSVTLECLVSPQGLVTTVKLVRGIPLLNTSAIDAVTQWMYTPTLKDGVPVPVILTVTVRFDL
jgi:protein TonB